MEKRENRRHPTSASIVCSYLTSFRHSLTFEGKTMNCSCSGLCAELQTRFKRGTLLVVRATGCASGSSPRDGFRSLSLAEVKWSNPRPVNGGTRYTTGMQYLCL